MSTTNVASPHQASPERARKIELLSFIVTAVVSLGGLGYSVYSIKQVNNELRINKEEQITGRYTAAVTNLGDDAMAVRLGGVYALQRIMQDSIRDQPAIATILAAYVRTHADKPVPKGKEVQADVQAALSVLVTRDSSHDGGFSFDLHSTHLYKAALAKADLASVDLANTDLHGANLSKADLRHASLNDANLSKAWLLEANLRDADLLEANLSNADLTGANLSNADLLEANLSKADLTGADLHDADLFELNLSNADMTDANLRGVLLSLANLSNADLAGADLHDAGLFGVDLRGADLSDANLSHAILDDANLRHADLTNADLTGVRGATVKQVVSAFVRATTKLPPSLAKDPSVRARIAEVERQATREAQRWRINP
jgi:uncharacterized protein YjbI with pentapeptide repeats